MVFKTREDLMKNLIIFIVIELLSFFAFTYATIEFVSLNKWILAGVMIVANLLAVVGAIRNYKWKRDNGFFSK